MYPLTPDARKGAVELQPYSETVARGLHVSPMGGLSGQHDNVRTYWENQLTQTALRPVRFREGSFGKGRGAEGTDSRLGVAGPGTATCC